MGASISHCPDNPALAGLTADSIEKYYDNLHQKRKEHRDTHNPGDEPVNGNNGTGEDEEAKKEGLGEDDTSDIIDGTGVDPGNTIAAKMNLDAALQAIEMQDKDALNNAISSLAKLGLQLNQMAKVVAAWVKEHSYLTVSIVLAFFLFACTPAIVGAAGFGAGGVVAGSVAAGIQAGIGNVAAGSAFAVLTSAGMGGAGLTTVMGVSACIPAAVAGGAALWTSWQNKTKDEEHKID